MIIPENIQQKYSTSLPKIIIKSENIQQQYNMIKLLFYLYEITISI